ncbi:hypothetical protein [Kocuria nitroreducens]|uniref:hypothetical protein n=1 Tax=Kocuria nitroreducens TaxID=3058914 RepID=UPI0036DE54AE
MEPQAGEPEVLKKRRTRLWWFAAWLLPTFVADELLEAALDRMPATGGYRSSSAVLGLLALAVCFIWIQRTHVKHARLVAEGDPDPLPAAYDHVTRPGAGSSSGGVRRCRAGRSRCCCWSCSGRPLLCRPGRSSAPPR